MDCGIAAHPVPKIPSAKIRWNVVALNFLGSRGHPPHWLSSKGPNYQRGVLLISAGAFERCFEGKSHGKITKVFLFLHDNAPFHRVLSTQKKLAYLDFQCLEHASYSSDLTPSDYNPFPGIKKNWKLAIFLPTWRSLLPRRPGWTDNSLDFRVSWKS